MRKTILSFQISYFNCKALLSTVSLAVLFSYGRAVRSSAQGQFIELLVATLRVRETTFVVIAGCTGWAPRFMHPATQFAVFGVMLSQPFRLRERKANRWLLQAARSEPSTPDDAAALFENESEVAEATVA